MRSIFRTHHSLALLAGLLTLTLIACPSPQKEESEAEAPPQRVENPSLGVAYADIDEGFTVAENGAGVLRLERTGDASGSLWIELEEEQRAGVNLVKQVNEWKTRFESMPGGVFLGQVELGSQFGTTYSVRGRYEEGGQLFEERRILTLYPGANRTLSLAYRYPAPEGDPSSDAARLESQERTNQMFSQMGHLEAITPSPAENAGETGGGR